MGTKAPDKKNPFLVRTPVRPTRTPNANRGITVNKTNVSDVEPGSSTPTDGAVSTTNSHPLSQCRAFRAKSLMDRRNLLNQHSICFRCLSSSTHQAKDCTTPVKCTECHSDKHLAALHAGPPSGSVEQNNDPRGAQQNGEEPTNVVASCKEVCGTSTGEKSCSKICPANIYPQGHPESKIKAYAVIAPWPSRRCLSYLT